MQYRYFLKQILWLGLYSGMISLCSSSQEMVETFYIQFKYRKKNHQFPIKSNATVKQLKDKVDNQIKNHDKSSTLIYQREVKQDPILLSNLDLNRSSTLVILINKKKFLKLMISKEQVTKRKKSIAHFDNNFLSTMKMYTPKLDFLDKFKPEVVLANMSKTSEEKRKKVFFTMIILPVVRADATLLWHEKLLPFYLFILRGYQPFDIKGSSTEPPSLELEMPIESEKGVLEKVKEYVGDQLQTISDFALGSYNPFNLKSESIKLTTPKTTISKESSKGALERLEAYVYERLYLLIDGMLRDENIYSNSLPVTIVKIAVTYLFSGLPLETTRNAYQEEMHTLGTLQRIESTCRVSC